LIYQTAVNGKQTNRTAEVNTHKAKCSFDSASRFSFFQGNVPEKVSPKSQPTVPNTKVYSDFRSTAKF